MRRSGWLKRVAPPQSKDRPMGLPPKPTPGVGNIGRPAPVEVHLHGEMTEQKVREIVRDELRRAANGTRRF